MRVLFTHSYALRLDPKQWKASRPYPPLGTLLALAAARAAGHQAALHDATFSAGAADLPAALDRHRPDLLVLWDDSFNWLTKMCLGVMEEQALQMIAAARARGVRVLVYGSDATDHRPRYLEAGADAVLLGDAETALVEVLDRIEAGRDLAGVVGVARLVEGRVQETGRRRSPPELDALPAPAWDAVDLRPYASAWRRHGRFSLNLVSSRGCPYGCAWCAKPLFGRQYLVHSPRRMAEEMAELAGRGARHVWFCDDIFGLTAEWAEGFADAVAASGRRLPFMIQTRADLMVKDDLRRALVRAGLETAWLGAESGSQKVLDRMNKGITVEQTRESVRKLQAEGARVGLFLQFGYLGEERADIEATLRLVTELLPDEIGVSVSYPLPGTPFHEEVRQGLGGKTNWIDSDDLDPLHPGAYPPEFYRRLHRYTHHLFQAHRGRAAAIRLIGSPGRASLTALRRAVLTAWHVPQAALRARALWRGVDAPLRSRPPAPA